MTTTIQVNEKQLKKLLKHKSEFRLPYYLIIEGYHRLIQKYNLNEELNIVMAELRTKTKK